MNTLLASCLVLAVALSATATAQSQPKKPATPSPLQVAEKVQESFAAVAQRGFASVVNISTYRRVADTGKEGDGKPAVRKPQPPQEEGDLTQPAPQADNKTEEWRVASEELQRYPGFRRYKSGSGILLDKEGYILCCRHSLLMADGQLAKVISVETKDRRFTLSRVVGTEPTINLALLKLEVYPEMRPPEFLPAVIGKSEELVVGHWAIAMGDPAGPVRGFSVGVFSGRPERQCYQGDLTATYMQAALSVHPETYGGPLLNIRGEVMGMLTPTAGADLPGLTFALPIDVAMGIAKALKVKQSHQSPWLGFSILEMARHRADLRKSNPAALKTLQAPPSGVYIDDVFDPSPAATLGVQVGDFLVELDGHRLLSVLDFQKWLYLSGVGREVQMKIVRAGKTLELQAKIEARPKSIVPR